MSGRGNDGEGDQNFWSTNQYLIAEVGNGTSANVV